MSYLEHTMLKDEHVVFITKPHWIIFSTSVVLLVLAFLVFHFGARVPLVGIMVLHLPFYKLIGAAVIIVALYFIISALITYVASEYDVTNMRVLIKHGLVLRTSHEIFLEKIEAVDVHQGMLGRLFNFGIVSIKGTGGSMDRTLNVFQPIEFKRIVQQEIETLFKTYKGGATSGTP